MLLCPNIGWSQPGGNCCVQSIMAGLKMPQQRSWKKETRFRTTPKLQRQTEKNHNRNFFVQNLILWRWKLLASNGLLPLNLLHFNPFLIFAYLYFFSLLYSLSPKAILWKLWLVLEINITISLHAYSTCKMPNNVRDNVIWHCLIRIIQHH